MFALGGNRDGATASVPLALDSAWCIDSMFGGALLREAAAAARRVAGLDAWIAVESSIRFTRPMDPGAALARVEVLHRGRRSAVVSVRLEQRDRLGAVALLTLAPEESVPRASPGEPQHLPAAAAAPAGPRAAVARAVDWRIAGDWSPADGVLEAWIAPRGATAPPPADWCLVASDVLVPALPGAARDLPMRLASISLDVSLLARPAGVWLAQRIEARVAGDVAHASTRMLSPSGTLVARALHRGVLLPATADEMPYSAAGFGWGVAI